MSADLYKTLELERDATAVDIKKAYRRLALKYHPDQNDGDKAAEEKFKEISEAYSVLSDANKRAEYDRTGRVSGASPFGAGGFQGGVPFTGMNDVFIDILNDLFGIHRRQGHARRGSDLKFNLEITLEEAAEGITKSIEIPQIEECEVCRGSGAKPGSKPKTCQSCHGTGTVRMQQGFFSMSRSCSACGGSGEVIDHPCETCSGRGRVTRTTRLSVDVPRGVPDGQRMRWRDRGEPGLGGGPAGDLYVVISIAPHAMFTRDGDDISCVVPISFVQAALGAEIDVPVLGGTVKMKVPAATQSGKILRLRGKGITAVGGKRSGDELVTVVVETPTNLTERQEELLREFAEISGDDVQPHRKGFLDTMRQWLS